jgi:hypothetical protein
MFELVVNETELLLLAVNINDHYTNQRDVCLLGLVFWNNCPRRIIERFNVVVDSLIPS